MKVAEFAMNLKSNNIFEDILLPIRERKISLDDSNSYVFFCRYIGLQSEAEYYNKILSLHRELSKLGDLYLLFKFKIDIIVDQRITKEVTYYAKEVNLTNFISGDIVDIFQQKELFKICKNNEINIKLKNALREIIKLYSINEKLSNITIGINFFVKLLCWAKEYISPRSDSFMTIYNPKVVYYGDIKKHEGYFLILLSLIGYDVLFINSFGDEIFKAIDTENKYSFIFEESNISRVKDMELLISKATTKNISKTIVIDSKDIFNDILVPISKRQDFHENTLYPVYFMRYIGIEAEDGSTLDSYYNSIVILDKKFNSLKNGYLRFDRPIPMISKEETSSIVSDILIEPNFFDLTKKDVFINKIINLKGFPRSNDENMDFQIKTAFKEIIYIYIEKEENINSSKVQNFVIKLIGWINKYINLLFKELIKEDNPKILYYGQIKSHDIYFLIYFSKLGCDVIYINSDYCYDKLFEDIDDKQQFTRVMKFKNVRPLEEFPIIEKQVRKPTVAYNASREIEQVIYGDVEVGLFKAWQYEGGITSAVGLKTTYEELKLLWNEPAKIRPEFKVENNTVYVPNLFVKINGIFTNINDYWNDYKYFIDAQNTYVIKEIPFTKINYSKQELYSTAFLFNENGLVDRDKLFNSQFYKFGYLKNSLQNFIVYKINELILSKPFIKDIDEKFKFKILMTIINMEDEVLKLLEKFDFTAEVPKLVIYANSRTGFSDEDIILIAFMKQIGADIILFTPTNYNNIESALNRNLFDIHQLPTVGFDLEIPNVSLPIIKNTRGSIFKFFNFKGGN